MIKKSQVLWLSSRHSDFELEACNYFARNHHLRCVDATEVFTDLFTASVQPNFICCAFEHLLLGELTLIGDLRQRYPHLPVVLITRNPSADLALWALRAGLHDVLSSPVSQEAADACGRSALKAQGVDRRSAKPSDDPLERAQPIAPLLRSRSARLRQLARLREQFLDQLDRDLSCRDGARMCHYSESHFSHRFSAEFGVTFAHYKMKCRIERACELLRNPDCTIAEVASLVGITDASYFSRVFRALIGRTPSQYRQWFMSRAREADHAAAQQEMAG